MDGQADPLLGRVLANRYRIASLIGQGGMGAVYEAEQRPLGRSVVVKVMHAEYAQDASFRERFIREAKAVAALTHPNIVSVHDFGMTEDGLLFLAMERLQGRTLFELVRAAGPLPEERVLRLLTGICKALAEVHALGIVHRDLKPENVFVSTSTTGDEMVKVLDFGLAKLMPTRTASRVQQSLIVGTPGYMSPEQMQGKEIGPRTDVYALGILWWEMLTGKQPFADVDDVHERMLRQVVEGIPAPTSIQPRELAPGHELALMSLLQKDPALRPAHAGEVLALIRGFAHSLWLDVSGEAPPLVTPVLTRSATSTPTKIDRKSPVPAAPASDSVVEQKRWRVAAGAAVAAVVVVVAVVAWLAQGPSADREVRTGLEGGGGAVTGLQGSRGTRGTTSTTDAAATVTPATATAAATTATVTPAAAATTTTATPVVKATKLAKATSGAKPATAAATPSATTSTTATTAATATTSAATIAPAPAPTAPDATTAPPTTTKEKGKELPRTGVLNPFGEAQGK